MGRYFTRLKRLFLHLTTGSRPARQDGLSAVEYEAVTLIAYEGHMAYARARQQARYCRQKGSEDGFRFWSQVAAEVRLRTKGRSSEQRL